MIREVNSDDIIAIQELIKELDSNVQIDINNDPFTHYYLFYEDSEIKGFISYAIIYERCELNYILVKSKYRHQGIASKLIEHMIKYCYNSNCVNITLSK